MIQVLTTMRRVLLLAGALLLASCGGGSGSGTPPAVAPPPPPPAITKAQRDDAARFLSRATFGVPYDQLDALVRQGFAAWLTESFARPISRHQQTVDDLYARRDRGDFDTFSADVDVEFLFRRLAWWHTSVTGSDALRQRVAFALSEIFVVSDRVDILIVYPYALANYYDTLLEHAFGNYRDLLRAVTLHPAMGVYLSHLNNRRADPDNNIFPDENYARECMQLFSIGLFELNDDGSQRLDGNGDAIPTYDNDDIREFAKIFTGLSYAGPGARFPGTQPYFRAPMQMFDQFHEPGAKVLLRGEQVAAGQTGMQDIDAAIDNLFNHPNVGPFIGRQLIQRLVTSNPSPAYVRRVAQAFNGNANGVRGDMQAVLRAVLLDPEAQATSDPDRDFGKLREPVERYVAMLRQFNVSSADGFVAIAGYLVQELGRQHPLSAPSVFNFFSPDHAPAGEIAAANLVAPEFEITDSGTIIALSNLIDLAVSANVISDLDGPFAPLELDLSGYLALADNPEELVDRLDTLLTYGTLSDDSRDTILSALRELPDAGTRVLTAVYLFLISPDYAVRI